MLDLSYLISPVLAAKICHKIKNYDKMVGKFKYNSDIFIINRQGYYNLSISNNADTCNKGSGTVGGAVSTATVEKV